MSKYPHLLFVILILLFCLSASQATALPFRSDLNKGNDLYQKGKYSQAQEMYNNILKKRANDQKAKFNAGDSLYKQGKYKESQKMFEFLTKEDKVKKDLRQKSFYNLGNSFFKQEDYQAAINAYEQALKLNPKDKEAQFNLTLAKKMLVMPRQERKNQKEKEGKEQGKKKNEQKEKERQKKEERKDKDNRQPGPKAGEMSKEDALRILRALEDQEKHKAQRVEAGKEKANDKDW